MRAQLCFRWCYGLLLVLSVLAPLPVRSAALEQAGYKSVPYAAVPGVFTAPATPGANYVFAVENYNTTLTVAGATPTVEAQIAVLARQSPAQRVQIWGTRYFDPKPAELVDLVISEILVGERDQAPPAPSSAPQAVVNFPSVNLFATAAQTPNVVGQAVAGEICVVQARDQSGDWLLVDCGDKKGWIDRRVVAVSQDPTTLPVSSADLTPKPSTTVNTYVPVVEPATPPPSARGWLVSYFNNPDLKGSPVSYDDIERIDLNWGYSSPSPQVPVDYFSARFERTVNFSPGYYRLYAQADDGVRFYVDDAAVIDEWHGATGQVYSVNRYLDGNHKLRVEFLELVGIASIRAGYDFAGQDLPWAATYYAGATAPRTQPLYEQREIGGSIQLDRTWGFGSPVPGKVPADDWNGRWSGQFQFDGGNYMFRARSINGVRVWINDQLVIDAWYDRPVDTQNPFKGVGLGKHTITVDYYKRTGYGYLQVWWYKETTPSPAPVPQ